MGIKVGMRKPVYPKWVDDAIKQLFLDNKNQIVKSIIYALMEPVTDGIKLYEGLRKMTNRISILPSMDNALAALMIGAPILAWSTSQKRGDKIKVEK